MHKKLKLAALACSTLILAGCSLQKPVVDKPSATPEMTPVASAAPTETTAPAESAAPTQTYTLADVSQHATKDDCWMAVHGAVYNVTPVTTAGSHPGGPVILKGCGKDATTMFMERGGKGEHSEQAQSFLTTLKIGALAQ